MKNNNTLSRNLRLIVGLLFAAGALLVPIHDAIAEPTVSSVTITSTATNNYYKLNDKIQATVTFSETVKMVTISADKTPRLTLKIGAADKIAKYKTGSSTSKLIFEYTVAAGDADTDGISIAANSFDSNGAAITNAIGNQSATVTHTALATQSSHKVDGVVPTVSSITITSTANSGNTYQASEPIQATVTFSESVTVTGTPQLTLKIGTADKTASYASGSGSASLVFAYTVAVGDDDADGISIAANQLTLNSGTIKDAVGNAATLTHTALATQTNHKVGGPPTIASIAVTSQPLGIFKFYKVGEVIGVTVTFSESVKVSGTPQLILRIGTEDKAANYKYKQGTTQLIFQYVVAAGDTDTDGISIAANSLRRNGGTITDIAGIAATLTHAAVPAQDKHKVDGIAPTVQEIKIISQAGGDNTYGIGDEIEVEVTFSEQLQVETFLGKEQWISLKVGTAERKAFHPLDENNSIAIIQKVVFKYTVAVGDVDTDGVSIDENKIGYNGFWRFGDLPLNPPDLTHAPLTTGALHTVDGIKPRVQKIEITSKPGPDKIYKTGDFIEATVTFTEKVNLAGDQMLLSIDIGGLPVNLFCTGGSDTTALVFSNSIIANDIDTDGVSIGAGELKFLNNNIGTLKDTVGNDAILTHPALPTQPDHKVDAIAPTISSITCTSDPGIDKTYKPGDTIHVTVTFTEKVNVNNYPELWVDIGGHSKRFVYLSGGGTPNLVFDYTINAVLDSDDTDGISIAANKLTLPTAATITDIPGNTAALTHAAVPADTDHKVDTTAPTVATTNGVTLTSSAGSDRTYKPGDIIQATVKFTEYVRPTGIPQLTLKIGSENRAAGYERYGTDPSDGTDPSAKDDIDYKKLVFAYTVATGDMDTDGIEIAANKLTLNGGTITDPVGNPATLTHAALPPQVDHKVNGVVPTIVANGLKIISTTAPYTVDETIRVQVTFSEVVKVTGTPQLTLTIGTVDRIANWTGGSGTTKLVFAYRVATGDTDTDGISIAANQLALNGGTLTDLAGNVVALTHPVLPTQPDHRVDATDPLIAPNGISITSTAGTDSTYKIGDPIQATVAFTESVTVTGTPQLTLKIGTSNRTASYVRGSGTPHLVFAYTVAAGDTDTDGISIAANQLARNGGTIKDSIGNNAHRNHTALSADAAHKVDGVAPTVATTNGIEITSTPFSHNTYKKDDTIQVTVTFTENVTLSGTLQLTLKIGTENRGANCTTGSGTAKLIFEYTVVAGDTDEKGISIAANQLTLNGGTLTDGAGNAATLAHAALPIQERHKVDAVAIQQLVKQPTQDLMQHAVQQPLVSETTVSSLAITSTPGTDNTYAPGDVIRATVSFTESVTVSGTPQLTLKIGKANKIANYATGTGTRNLVFAYTVVSGDTDTDGITIEANQLSLNGGTITDTAGNPATLTHDALGAFGAQGAFAAGGAFSAQAVRSGAQMVSLSSHKVDGVSPSVSTNGIAITSTPPNNTYGLNDTIRATVSFTESVKVSGTPQLTLKIGTENRVANWTTGSGTAKLVFEYTVVAGDTDTDGISIEANQLSGTITDMTGNVATLTHTALAAQVLHKVITTVPPQEPVQESPQQHVQQPVEQSPQQPVQQSTQHPVQESPQQPTQQPTQHPVQESTQQPTQQPTKQSVQEPVQESPQQPVQESTRQPTQQPVQEPVQESTQQPTQPTVLSVSLTSVGPYSVGRNVEATVNISQSVPVTGTSTLTLVIGTTEKTALYNRGSGNSLVFSYTVVAGDTDADGVAVKANSLSLNGTTLTHSAVSSAASSHAVDTTPPSVRSLALSSTGPYAVSDTIEVTVTTTEPVAVTDSPTLTLILGETEKRADYQSGSGTNTLVFSYTVAAEDSDDLNGVSVKANSLTGGTLKDTAQNPLIPDHPTLPDQGVQHRVDTTLTDAAGDALTLTQDSVATADETQAPGMPLSDIHSLAFTSTGPYKVEDVIQITVTTAEQVTVTGTPRIPMTIGEKTAYASYVNGTGTTALVFQYTVVDGDEDPDGIEIPENALEQDSGSAIKNSDHTDINLNHPNVAADVKHIVDTTHPAITSDATPTEDTAKNLSPGTPGYLQNARTHLSERVPVSVSEVMFTTGASGRLPQWIELYNASKTDVVTLQGWELQVEMVDPNNQPMHRFITFPIERALRILPNQTVLVVAKAGRNSQHFPEPRLYNLTTQHPEAVDSLGPNADLLGDYGYAIVLRDASGTEIDIAGNLDGDGSTDDVPSWKLPNCITANGFRASIIRHYEDGMPLIGDRKTSWFRATEMRREIVTYWGHSRDVGNPGWKKGGPLPVQLSSFKAERTEQGALLEWTTESELENAGFNVLRCESKTGTFTVVTPRMLQGAGTTSERSTYQYVDMTAKEGVAYYYRLEEVSYAGVRQSLATRRLRGHVSAANRLLTTFGSLKAPTH